MNTKEEIKVVHNLSNKVTDLIHRIGIVVDDGGGRFFYHLPQWFEITPNGAVETPINKLPKIVKEISDQQSKIKAIEFAEWISNHPLDFQTDIERNWIGLDMKTYTTEELYTLYNQSLK